MNLDDAFYPLLSTYARMPYRLKSALGSTYRHIPRRLRLGPGYDGFDNLAREVESWPAQRVADYQLEQLCLVLLHAVRHSPFYAHRFAEVAFYPSKMGSFEDLQTCPYLTKEDLVRDLDSIATTQPSRSDRLYVTTGGSTGSPVGLYLHKGVSRPKEQAFLEAQWRRAGYFDGARLAVLRGYVATARPLGAVASYDAIRDWLMLSPHHLTAERLPEYLDHIARFRPDILHAYPSAALQLADLLESTGEHWPTPLRCVLAGSERLTKAQKQLLEDTFGCRVYTWYGHTERVVLAGEGRYSDLLYFCPAYGYVEFGPPDTDGLCEVIGTSFHNLVMPLVRYRTGDWVRPYDLARDGPKELDWPAVPTVEGRGHEFLVTSTGRKISLTAFNMHDRSFDGLYALQFFQDQAGKAELRYVAGPQFDDARLPEIASLVQNKLGDDIVVVLREVSDIERTKRGKGKWLVSSLGPDQTRTGTSLSER
jgi:phenylacetate-CoA ligase